MLVPNANFFINILSLLYHVIQNVVIFRATKCFEALTKMQFSKDAELQKMWQNSFIQVLQKPVKLNANRVVCHFTHNF